MSDKLIKASDAVDIVARHSALYGDGEVSTDDGEALLYDIMSEIMNLSSAQPERKYEHHIDHTDCIWRTDEDSKCPSTCSQYRDGWNDAMDYIFRDGKGYRPYRRGKKYE